MPTAKLAVVLLTLANAANFRSRALKNAAGLTAHVQKGQTIKVTEEMAEHLSSDDYMATSRDGEEELPYFVVAADGTKVDHDFTVDHAALGARATTHDLASLPEAHLITDAVAPGGTLARNPSGRTQRAARK